MLLGIDTGKTHSASCSCPACLGLQCLTRPRYFSGQLLTETELNSEQAYMLAKQRLHNRYLHGSGIVCGLQVSCSTSTGSVSVQSGYAIDPCGNDIIVCNAQDFNVLQHIRACDDERKRQRKSNCDPLKSPQDTNCQNIERHFCLTIAYNEQETRFTSTLRPGSTSTTSTSNGCGCSSNGNGKKSGCGCGGSQSTASTSANSMSSTMRSSTMAQSGQSSQSNMPLGCEPTRILEGYQLDLCEVSSDYCASAKIELEDTLLTKVIACVTTLRGFLEKRIPNRAVKALTSLAFTGNADASPEELYQYCCYLRQAISELYAQDPLNTHCQTQDILSQIVCQAPPQEKDQLDARASYVGQARTTLYDLLALLVQYALNCICQALIPPCPPVQMDDRLILACMTVSNNQIIDICDFCHRRYAGSFPALYYWLSLAPIIPLLAYAVQRICCYDWLTLQTTNGQKNRSEAIAQANLINGLTNLLDRIDPSGNLRKEIFAGNFALPKNYTARFGRIIAPLFSLGKITDLLHPEGFNLYQLIDKPETEATASLKAAGVNPIVQPVSSANEVPVLRSLATPPFASPGEQVVLFVDKDGKVISFASHTPSPEISEIRGHIETLRNDLNQALQATEISDLRRDIDALKSEIEKVPQPSDISAINNKIEVLSADLAKTSDVDQLRDEVGQLKGSLEAAASKNEVSQLSQEVDTLKGQLANAAQAADVSKTTEEIAALQKQLADVQQTANAGISKATEDIKTLQTEVANAPQPSDISQIRDDIATLKNQVAETPKKPEIDGIQNDIKGLQNELTNFAQANDLSQLRNEMQTLRGDLEKADQAAASSQEVSELQATIKDLRTEIADLKSQIEQLTSLKGEVEQLTALKGEVEQLTSLKGEVEQLKARETGEPKTDETPPPAPENPQV